MGTNKPKLAVRPLAPWIGVLLRPQNRGLALAGIVIAAALGGFAYSWQRWGKLATGGPEYLVTPERIEVTPPPAWIHSNVKADVIRSAALSRLDLRERNLVERIASAFALHPWVAKVVRVEKQFPSKVLVDLAYRRPVAVVEVANRSNSGLLFVDEQSVLLPSADFAPSQAKDYLRIADGNETPAGYGAPWGSERISGAARIAAVWGQRWQPLGLYRIIGVQSAGGRWEYQLRTKEDARVIWGAPPGGETRPEPTPEQKIAALEQYIHDKGPLDRDGAQPIDLRELAGATGKTARESKAKKPTHQ